MSSPGNGVATRGATTAIAIHSGQDVFDDRQVAALAVLGVKDATKADLAVYFHVCRQTGLDPFLRQIYLIARQEKVRDQWVTKQTIQVGIDGFRVIRDRAAKRDGVEVEYSRTTWYDADGGEHKVWLSPGPPAGCEMTVYKNGRAYPAVLTYAEYVQVSKDGKPTGKWRDAGAHQIEKCCEAFGLRRAFPNDLAGIQLEDEIPAGEPPPPAAAARVTAEQVTSRPARQRPAPPARDEEIPLPPDPPGAPAADPPGLRPTGAALGKLGKLIRHVPLGAPADEVAFLSWQAGRPVTLETVTKAECAAVTAGLDSYLAAANGDADAAAEAIWTAYRADQVSAEQDAAAEAGQTGG
jgi:phage recombination protein Bet